MTSEMHVDKGKPDQIDSHLDLMDACGSDILTKLQFLMSVDENLSDDPPTPPEPLEFPEDLPGEFADDSNQQVNQQQVNEHQPQLDYFRLALKSWPDGDPFASRPSSHPASPNVFLKAPTTQSSSSSRDPSPSTITVENPEVKQLKRRYEPHSKNRKFQRKPPTDEELLFSRSAEDFRFGDLLSQQQKLILSDGRHVTSQCSPTSPGSPLPNFPTKTLHGSARKLSIRRLQRPRMVFDDQEAHSSDEMSNRRERMASNGCNLKNSQSGSLPTIVDIYSNGKQSEWENPSSSNPLLNKDSMITSTIAVETGSTGDFQVLRVPTFGSGDITNELPHSAPPLNNNDSLFVFERRKSLIQELPAITEDQVDDKNESWYSANGAGQDLNDDFLHKRSCSDYILEKRSPGLERRQSEKLSRTQTPEMRVVISGNPNLSDNEDTHSIESAKHLNGQADENGKNVLDYSHDSTDSLSRQKASSLVLQQDGSKTLQLVENSKSDYSELKAKIYPDDLTDSNLPEQGSRKARILKRKTKLKRHKSSLRSATRTAPISAAVDHIAPSLIKNVEDSREQVEIAPTAVILRTASALPSLTRKRSGTDKKKESKKIFSLFGSTRIKERKDSRSIFHNNNNDSTNGTIDEKIHKRLSMVELNFLSSSNRHSVDGLPDVLARVLSSTSETDLLKNGGSNSNCSSVEDTSWPQLHKSKWSDLDLWEDDPTSWSERFQKTMKLSAGEEKRQNIIYEFYTTEKRHCQVVVFLQQIFQVGLLQHNILTPNEVKALIPDVLDSILDFHLNLLRLIRKRIFADSVVPTISDIVYDEFKSGEHRTAAVKAYTDFCLARDESSRCYSEYLSKNSNFKLFCENLERYPILKKRGNFKSFFLLIVQRLTKYPSLIEQIIKYDSNPESKHQSQRALTAVRNFALRVDRELSFQLLNQRFEQIRSMIDKNSVGRVLGQKFTYEDLILGKGEFRRILSIGNVHWQSVNHQSFELTMLLFEDTIVFLQNKNNAFHFFSHKDHASVLPLHATLIREIPRSIMVMLVVIAQQTPDMYQLAFNSRGEMEKWVDALISAQKVAPKFVRLANRKLFVKGTNPNPAENDEESEEEKYNNQLTKWQDQLDSIFLTQMNSEPKLLKYMEERMEFLDQIRVHLTTFPLRPPSENNGAVSSSTVKSRNARELAKMKTILNGHFYDLRSFRRNQLDRLIEQAQKSRDDDLTSFFDDLHEIGHPNNGDPATFSSSSDENQPSTSERSCRPRRVQTWIGSKAETHQYDIIRRHTTVPKVSQQSDSTNNNEYQDSVQEVDERLQKLVLNSTSKSRRAATELIRECVALRVENDRLRSQNALQGIHLTALRTRKTAHETNEKLEYLRQKQEEVNTKELEFKKNYEKRLDQLKRREQELEQREAELKEREQQCGKENCSFELGDRDSINSSGISRDTSFRSGAVILNSSTSIPIQVTSSSSIPKNLAETKEKRAKK